MVADYPVWIDLTPRQLNAEDVVTAKLPNLTMGLDRDPAQERRQRGRVDILGGNR